MNMGQQHPVDRSRIDARGSKIGRQATAGRPHQVGGAAVDQIGPAARAQGKRVDRDARRGDVR